MSYNLFAGYYDMFSADVDYKRMAHHLLEMVQKHTDKCELVLDLCCGTGSLALELAQRGYEVIGVDGSADMLLLATEKLSEVDCKTPPIFLCQDMRELDLYGTVDAAFCTLDSINHLCSKQDVLTAFERLAFFVRPGGLFLFDVNTDHKHRNVLGDNCFVFEQQDVMCVWQNSLCPDSLAVDISLDFFSREQNELYTRESEDFCECYYSPEFLTEALAGAGFETLGFFGEFTDKPPKCDDQRILCVARRITKNEGA